MLVNMTKDQVIAIADLVKERLDYLRSQQHHFDEIANTENSFERDVLLDDPINRDYSDEIKMFEELDGNFNAVRVLLDSLGKREIEGPGVN